MQRFIGVESLRCKASTRPCNRIHLQMRSLNDVKDGGPSLLLLSFCLQTCARRQDVVTCEVVVQRHLALLAVDGDVLRLEVIERRLDQEAELV